MRLAEAHAAAMLPCPVCAVGVKGSNLGRHLVSKHPGAEPRQPPFRDRRRVTVAALDLEHDVVHLRTRFGLRRRSAALTDRLATGGLTRQRPDPIMSSYADECPGLAGSITEKAGVYLRVGAITVGCATSTGLRKHWTGAAQGKKRSRSDITVDPADFVAMQYALAACGSLQPRI